MAASTGDRITDVRNAARPNSAKVSSGRSAGGATLACDNLTGWPTASKVHFVTYKIDSSSTPIAGSQLDCTGIVSGNNIGSLVVVDGTDTGNAVNDVVEMLPTAAWAQDLADALTKEHSRTGAHNATAAATLAPLIKAITGPQLYPVGSIYINASDSTNPATLLGFGTWAAFGAGRVPVGKNTTGTFQTAGATGGEETHILTTTEMPSHTHGFNQGLNVYANKNFTGTGFNPVGVDGSGGVTINSTGGDGAHNNLQPYIVVYMWQRTA